MHIKRARTLKPAQIRHLLRVTEATSWRPERNALILLLGLICGMRISEICTAWRYSNVGLIFVARLIERAADMPLEAAIKQRVLTPLGISTLRFATERSELCGE
ncbi:Tyrosine recombinase XerD [Pandoraea cepalis]|uniref:Tyrosine recombinase XerD n=1 Tax=Pandoraea cepalis TaxID=2508294 RepID=A0A5E4Y824_9BURK|nr:serine hydrolase [Pandoraea cepalis]VVE44784.1 Tyrosine recombinase XerD [Pandoraea cepalis]